LLVHRDGVVVHFDFTIEGGFTGSSRRHKSIVFSMVLRAALEIQNPTVMTHEMVRSEKWMRSKMAYDVKIASSLR